MRWDVIIHSSAGILSLILGGLMIWSSVTWAVHAFSALMILAFVSAIIISWQTNSWVRGHYLAMLPVIGVGLGYLGVNGGFELAFILLCVAFGHLIYRGFVPPPSASN